MRSRAERRPADQWSIVRFRGAKRFPFVEGLHRDNAALAVHECFGECLCGLYRFTSRMDWLRPSPVFRVREGLTLGQALRWSTRANGVEIVGAEHVCEDRRIGGYAVGADVATEPEPLPGRTERDRRTN